MQLYKDLKNQASSINNLLGELGQIQKLYSSAYTIELRVRSKGKTHYLKIGRGEIFQGLYLDENPLPQELRQKDKFLEILRAKLSSRYLKNIEIDELDRVISLNYIQGQKINHFMMFYHGKSLYFAIIYFDFDTEKMTLMRSWSPKKDIIVDDRNKFDVFNEVGRTDLKDKISESKIVDPVELELLRCQKKDNKKEKFQKRKIKNISQDIERIDNAFKIYDKIDDIDFLTNLTPITNLEGIKFKFPDKNPYGRRSIIFDKLKKLKLGKEILLRRLNDTKVQGNKKDTLVLPRMSAPVWAKSRLQVRPLQSGQEKGYSIYAFDKFQIGIGKNANGNDSLRNEWAKKTDYWFHLDAATSPHIIVKTDLIIDENILIIVASIMREVLKIEHTQIDLIFTQVKNIKGVRGASGLVTYKKEKHLRVEINENWKDLIIDGHNT